MTRIFKPDSGADLKIQNNGGTGSVTMTDASGLTIDYPADIILDAEGADITLKDGGTTFGTLKQASGHLVIQPTSSKQIILNDEGGSAALTISTDGYVTKSNQPIFSAYLSAEQSNIVAGGWVDVDFDTLDFACSHYNTTNKDFTTPIAGKYQFNIFLRLNNLDKDATYYQISLNIGGSSYYGPIIDPNFTADLNYYFFSWACIVNLGASTAVKVQIYQHAGTDQTDIVDSTQQSKWSGFLIS